MGYRSEVCIGLTDDATRLLRTILDHIPETHEVHNLVKDAKTIHYHQVWEKQHKDPEVDCDSKMYWDYVKWYDSYDCVGFIEDFLENCIPEEDYKFVRIGEESDDISERGEYWDADIHVQRTISW
jgi:hypothetical protein